MKTFSDLKPGDILYCIKLPSTLDSDDPIISSKDPSNLSDIKIEELKILDIDWEWSDWRFLINDKYGHNFEEVYQAREKAEEDPDSDFYYCGDVYKEIWCDHCEGSWVIYPTDYYTMEFYAADKEAIEIGLRDYIDDCMNKMEDHLNRAEEYGNAINTIKKFLKI